MGADLAHPRCAHCGDRIGIYEPMWMQQADGTLANTTVLNLEDGLWQEQSARFFHVGCLAPDEIPHSQTG